METTWLARPDGTRLRVVRWRLRDARARCLVLAGRAEFVEKYEEVVRRLHDRGFDVWSFDWRGQGLSSRQEDVAPGAGHVDDFETYLKDLAAVRAHTVRDDRAGERWIGLAHSMGGHLLLRHLALRGPATAFRCAVLCSPMIRFRTGRVPLPAARVLAARAVRRGRAGEYAQKQPLPNPEGSRFADNVVTHDRARFVAAEALAAADPRLHVGGVTWGWLAAALRSCDILDQRETSARVAIPVLTVAAGDDRLVSTRATLRFMRRLQNARICTIRGARHEILMETDTVQEQFWSVFDAFVEEQL